MPQSAHAQERSGPVVPVWGDGWFPFAFTVDLAPDALYRVEISQRAYVVFRDRQGAWRALHDACPHRLARLSDGELVDGQVRCLYHGWRFDGDGACRHIPQLAAGQQIPAAACVPAAAVLEQQGMLWLRHDDSDPSPAPAAVPRIAALDDPTCRTIDFAIDLPYGHEFLIENVLDYAHIHVAHAGVRGGGQAALAGPIAFDLGPVTAAGFTAGLGPRAGGGVDDAAERGANRVPARVQFLAPGLVHYWSDFAAVGAPQRIAGLLLFAVPLGPGRCRLLYRAYGNGWSWRDRLRPRFLEHGHQCRLLEQDMAVVQGQAASIASMQESLAQRWLPLGSSDVLVLAYRRWLERFDHERSDFVGLQRRGPDSHRPQENVTPDRFWLHVRHCASCRAAMSAARWARALGLAGTLVLIALAAVTSGGWRYALAGTGVLAAMLVASADLLLCRLAGRRASLFQDPCQDLVR